MWDFAANLLNKTRETVDPTYVEEKEKALKECKNAKNTSIAVLIASIATTILGLGLCFTSALVLGLGLIVVSVPVTYFTYNFMRIFDNLGNIRENIYKYHNPITQTMDIPKFKKDILQGTLGFKWVVDLVAEKLRKSQVQVQATL